MGYYIQTRNAHNKANDIVTQEKSAKIIKPTEVQSEFDSGRGIVCVIDNKIFEAAGFCFNQQELEEFMHDGTARARKWISMDRERAEILSGYKR